MKSNSSLFSILALSGLSIAAMASNASADVAAQAPATSVKPAASAKPLASVKPSAKSPAATPETDAALFSDKANEAAPLHKTAKSVAAGAKLTSQPKVGPGATTLVASHTAKPAVEPDVALRVTAPVAPSTIKVAVAKPAKTVEKAKAAAVAKNDSSSKKTTRATLVSLPKAETAKNVAKPATPEAKPAAADVATVTDRTHPEELASRHKDAEMLAQLDADLDRSQQNLDKAGADLSEGQKQLASFGDVLNQAMLEAGPDAKGLNPFVKVAQRYAGTPYVWGGESRTGFDCSGFIMVVMRDLGYKALPHSAAEQFHYGLPIAQPLLKPGDLVFFANTYKPGISHVGIYLGHRRFIHAAGTGIGTIVSSLDNPHFQAKYARARRLVQSER